MSETVAITGASGLVGTALQSRLTALGHRVVRIGRAGSSGRAAADVLWDPFRGKFETLELEKLNGVSAVVHLAGDNIAQGRWTAKKKARIRESRVQGTEFLCRNLVKLANPPRVLVSASATGYYGERGNEECHEDSPPGTGFLTDVCREWEAACEPARLAGIRVVNLRIGVVLSPKGGALAKMLLPFRLCLGGVVGSGRQYWSWIALDDLVSSIIYSIEQAGLSGPVNAVSPCPATNLEFTKALGRVLRRPTIFPMPAFAARLALGEMADALLLASTRVVPRRLQSAGFTFQYSDLDSALVHLIKGR